MKRFKKPRKLDAALAERLLQESPELGPELVQNLQKALPAIALDGHLALSTAYANDCAPLMCFAQQVNGYGKAGDVLLAISTSGKSKNILYASVTARAIGMKVIGLTGAADSPLIPLCDVCIRAPLLETYQIQELHLPIYHCLCLMLEEHFFLRVSTFSRSTRLLQNTALVILTILRDTTHRKSVLQKRTACARQMQFKGLGFPNKHFEFRF